MEMVLQQRAASHAGGCRGGPRPSAATAPMMAAVGTAAPKQEPEREKDGEETEEAELLRRGPWTVDEDLTLINYIAEHGEGRWNALARAAGLKRTGKSCRLRWLNYLRPDVKRGDFTADEQLLILDLHSRWGNRWSKIAAHLPGRTDNEIKNYWRTRVQKHAKQLNCDVNSKRFKDAMRFLWMPRLAERAAAAHHQPPPPSLHLLAVSGDDAPCSGSALTTTASACFDTTSAYAAADRSPCSSLTSSSSESATTTAHDGHHTSAAAVPALSDWAAMQQQQDHDEYWSTASALQQLTAGAGDQLLFHQAAVDGLPQDLSGWVQGFSECASLPADAQLWSLDDIWRMQ